MKTNPIWSFFLILLMLNSCIVIKSRKVDDGSAALTKEDSTKIFPFDVTTFHKTYEYSAPSWINFQRIDAGELKEIIAGRKYSWVMFVASWCPISKKSMIQNSHLITRFPEDSIQLIIISQDLNIKDLQEELFESNYDHMPYLMNSKKYGTDEVSKQENFIKDFDKKIPLGRFKQGGVPANLLFNNNAELLYVTGGGLINCDTIKKYTSLGCRKNQ